MITLIVGTTGSGKSKKAESIALKQAKGGEKVYVATMIPFGKEGETRVKKHRRMRFGKGFKTIECPTDVHKVGESLIKMKRPTVLLECMSNLVGNELYKFENAEKGDNAMEELIVNSVMKLAGSAVNMIIVANEFPEDDENYDEETKRFVFLCHKVNENLAGKADVVERLENGEWKRIENN